MQQDILDLASFSVGLVIAVVWFGRRANDPAEAGRWAEWHGLAAQGPTWPSICSYVRTSTWLRVIGGAAGVAIGVLIDRALLVSTTAGAGGWWWLVAGWLVGGVYAHRVTVRSLPGAEPVASLLPRRAAHYLSPIARWSPAASAAAVVAIAVLGSIAASPQDLAPHDRRWLASLALLASVSAGAAMLGIRRLIARGQPVGDPHVLAFDDALRAATAHLIAGGTAAANLIVAMVASAAVLSPDHTPYGLSLWVPLALGIAAFVAGRFLAFLPWWVPRHRPTALLAS